jgi:hypothetical protein
MKLSAIGGRGAKKDFIDLHAMGHVLMIEGWVQDDLNNRPHE